MDLYSTNNNFVYSTNVATSSSNLNPVTHFLFNQTGSTFFDTTNTYSGTCIGSNINLVPGVVGSAISFDGTSYVNLGSNYNPQEFTVAFWINAGSLQRWQHIVSKGTHQSAGVPGTCNWAILNGSGPSASKQLLGELYQDTNWSSLQPTPELLNGSWNHYAMQSDGLTIGKHYLNGSIIGSVVLLTPILNDNRRSLCIGARADVTPAQQQFIGSIDDFRLYNKMLTIDDIKKIYNNGLGTRREDISIRQTFNMSTSLNNITIQGGEQ